MKAYHFRSCCKSSIKEVPLNNAPPYNINAVKNNLTPLTFISFDRQSKLENTNTNDEKT